MRAFCPGSNSAVLFLCAALWGCVTEKPGLGGTTSFAVEVLSPETLGTSEARLSDTQRTVRLSVTALDEMGAPDTAFSRPVDVYTQFLGTLTPRRGGSPLPRTVGLVAGSASAELSLPEAFGETFLWVEDARGDEASYATGASSALWFREPFLDDVSRPTDESAVDALARSPLEGKQVNVVASRFGAKGVLVVTGVFSQWYALSDVDCTSTPCVPTPYGHLVVFTFNRARADDGTSIRLGHLLARVSGGVVEFNGLTELGFPRTELARNEGGAVRNEALLPEPVTVKPSWLTGTGEGGPINLERLEGGLVAIENGTVCATSKDDVKYTQWTLDVGHGCGDETGIHLTTAGNKGAVPEFDVPPKGTKIKRVVGILSPLNFLLERGGQPDPKNLFLVLPRRLSDLTVH
jgi:hypothetical protein